MLSLNTYIAQKVLRPVQFGNQMPVTPFSRITDMFTEPHERMAFATKDEEDRPTTCVVVRATNRKGEATQYVVNVETTPGCISVSPDGISVVNGNFPDPTTTINHWLGNAAENTARRFWTESRR